MVLHPFLGNSKVGLLISLIPCYFWGQASAECLPEPIDVRIGNVTFEDYNNNVIRGLDISVGSPKQSFAFLPQTPLNNTFVYGVEDPLCGKSWSTNGCATFRGGLYDNTSSSSIGTAAAGSHPPEGAGYPPCEWVTDDVTLSSNTTVEDFAFGIALKDWGEQGYHPQSALGVGRNSSILNSLKQAGQIASRSWSMFWGLEGATADTQMDGIFVMGGYDRAKTSGPNYTSSLSYTNANCLTGMVVTISDITLNLANGSSASLFGGVNSAAVTACIDPDYPTLMAIPYDPYFTNFETITDTFITDRAFGINYYGMLYDEDTKPYTGDLTITLSNGLSVRITNDQLVIPELTVDEKSGAIISNSSTPELILNSQQEVNENDIARLGRQFFTAAYLMVNHDTNQYTLWQANATAEKDLVVVDENNDVWPDPCSADTPSSSSTSDPSVQQESGISSGGIAGAVVGSVAGAGLIIGALFFLLRKKNAAATQNVAPSPEKGSNKQAVDLIPRAAQELPADPHAPVELRELPDNNVFRQELPAGSETAFMSELPEKSEVARHPAELE